MTNLAKIRSFKELVHKLKGQYTKDADIMYYDCSGGQGTSDSSNITRFLCKDDGMIGTAFSVDYFTRKDINGIGYMDCSGYSMLEV